MHLIILLLLTILLASCGPSSAVQVSADRDHPDQLSADILPDINGLRNGSELRSTSLPADEYTDGTKKFPAGDVGIIMAAPEDAYEWAYWTFNPGDETVITLTVQSNGPPVGEVYFALADYGTGRWEFGDLTAANLMLQVDQDHVSAEGNLHCAILVSDGGSVEVVRLGLATEDDWQLVELGQSVADYAGNYLDAAMVDDRPAVAFYDGNGDARYLHAFDATGDEPEDWTVNQLLLEGANGRWIDLEVIDGHPAVAMHQHGSEELWYSISATPAGDGADWSEAVAILSDIRAEPSYFSLAEVAGHPAIAYQSNNQALNYIRSDTSQGSAPEDWQEIFEVNADTDEVGASCRLAVMDGQPAIAFYNGVLHQTQYIRSTGSLGIEDGAWMHTPAKVAGSGLRISLAEAGGLPMICYLDASLPDWGLSFRVPDGGNGEATLDWLNEVQVDHLQHETGNWNSMLVSEGTPWISYYDSFNGDLKLAMADFSSAPAFTDWNIITVDSEGDVGRGSSLLVVNGRPAVFYVDLTNDTLKYAVLTGPVL